MVDLCWFVVLVWLLFGVLVVGLVARLLFGFASLGVGGLFMCGGFVCVC